MAEKKSIKLKRIRSRGHLGEKAYDRLKEGILSGELPPGAMLNEVEVTKALNISRTPLREAFNRLKAEGLLEIMPRKGARVASLTPGYLDDLFEAREAIETTFFVHSAKQMTPEDIDRIRQALKTAENDLVEHADDSEALKKAQRKYIAADRAFHDELVQNTGNRVWIDMYYNIRDRIEFCGRLVLRVPERFRLVLKEHNDVLDALAGREFELARDLMARHIRNVRVSMEYVEPEGGAESEPEG